MEESSVDITSITVRYKVVILGDVNVGKTSFNKRLTDNKFKAEYEPSRGFDFASKSIKYKDK